MVPVADDVLLQMQLMESVSVIIKVAVCITSLKAAVATNKSFFLQFSSEYKTADLSSFDAICESIIIDVAKRSALASPGVPSIILEESLPDDIC